ncbi:MAG: RluA family pseudouridine synthase [Alphaproteobacteria bacterium]
MNKFFFKITQDYAGTRIDKYLATEFISLKPEITRSKIQNLIAENYVKNFDDKIINTDSYKLKINDEISVEIPDNKPSDLIAKKIDFEIIYQDKHLIIINKPFGLTVHPGAGNNEDTLVNGLLYKFASELSSIAGSSRLGIVHRLDKDTSGLMIIAKDDLTHQLLSKMLKDRDISRSYLALIYGVMDPKKGVIRKNIIRSRKNRLKMAIVKNIGREAITNYETKEIFMEGFASLVECNLQTGRTHQIRLHLESMKHSVMGDQLYNSCKKMLPKNANPKLQKFLQDFQRQALHSYKINFIHPITNEELSFEIPLPTDILELYNLLKNHG